MHALRAIAAAGAIIIGPSNPLASIAPILAVPGIREAMLASDAPVIAVSPVVAGEVLKGPTASFMAYAGHRRERLGGRRLLRRSAQRDRGRRGRRGAADAQDRHPHGRRRRAGAARAGDARRSRGDARIADAHGRGSSRQALHSSQSSAWARASTTARLDLARAMVGDVLDALARTRSLSARSSSRRESIAGTAHGPRRERDRRRPPRVASPRPSRLASRSQHPEGFERVLCVPGDCPALDPAELDAASERPSGSARRRRAVAIVPDRHGAGTQRPSAHPARCHRPGFGPGAAPATRVSRATPGSLVQVRAPVLAAARHRHRRRPRRSARAARPGAGRSRADPRGAGCRGPPRANRDERPGPEHTIDDAVLSAHPLSGHPRDPRGRRTSPS